MPWRSPATCTSVHLSVGATQDIRAGDRWCASFGLPVSKKSPTNGPTERTPKKPEYHIARSQPTEQGPLVRSSSIFDGQLGPRWAPSRLPLLMKNGHDPFPNHDLYGLSFQNVVSGKTRKHVFLLTLPSTMFGEFVDFTRKKIVTWNTDGAV